MLDIAITPGTVKEPAQAATTRHSGTQDGARQTLSEVMARQPVLLAPMEDVSDIVFREICRDLGADMTYTEFINVDGLLYGARIAIRKIALGVDEWPVGIQIYGSDPRRLVEAAQVAEQHDPTVLDINCGCWVPKIAARGAGSGWLRNLPAMEEMVRAVARAVSVPVTVKTRIGWGDGEPPVLEIVRRLENAGAAAITLHCRTALQRHDGLADWSWAARAQEVVSIPVIVNGGVAGPTDAVTAMTQTRCAGVMVARAAIGNPWIFRQVRAALIAAGIQARGARRGGRRRSAGIPVGAHSSVPAPFSHGGRATWRKAWRGRDTAASQRLPARRAGWRSAARPPEPRTYTARLSGPA